MLPEAQLEIWTPFEFPVRRDHHVAGLRFLHPDDVEKDRSLHEVLTWPFAMPLHGVFKSANPSLAALPLLAPDPHFNNWLFYIESVYEFDWNSLLTAEEYQDYVRTNPNLLNLSWSRSFYADPWLTDELGYAPKSPKRSTKDFLKELIDKQKTGKS